MMSSDEIKEERGRPLNFWLREICLQAAGIRESLAAAGGWSIAESRRRGFFAPCPPAGSDENAGGFDPGPMASGYGPPVRHSDDPPAVGNPMPDVLRSCAQTIEENRINWQESIEYLRGYAAAVGLCLAERRPADPDCHSDVVTAAGLYCSACGEWIAPNSPAGRPVADDSAGIGDGERAPIDSQLIGIAGRPVGDPLAWPIVAPSDGVGGRFGVWFGPGPAAMTFDSIQEAENWIVRRRVDEANVAAANPVRDYMGPVTPCRRHVFVRRLESGLCDECGGGRLHVIHVRFDHGGPR
jgi:hypothetical protein